MKFKLFILLLIPVLFLAGCDYFNLKSFNEWLDKNNSNIQTDVYIGGYYLNAGNNVPCYWKNGNKIDLPFPNAGGTGSQNIVNSIYVDGNDVYCGGNIFISGTQTNACYWKNGDLHVVKLDDPINFSSNITSIFVSAGIVFCAGEELGSACFWINDNAKNSLSTPATPSQANSIFIDINNKLNFYISGYYYISGNQYACYWKNGESCLTIGPANSQANSIFVSGGKVYIAGSTGGTDSCYWNDGILNNLSTGTAYSIFIYNGDIYVSGYDGAFANYWKNNIIQWSSNPTSGNGNSVFVINNDVYVAGQITANTACYWKNGRNPIILPGLNSSANSIAVILKN